MTTLYTWAFRPMTGLDEKDADSPVKFYSAEDAIEAFVEWYAENLDGDPSERQAIEEGMALMFDTPGRGQWAYVHPRCGMNRIGFTVLVSRYEDPPPRDTYYVALYLVDREYGGSEEGGWWYSTAELIRPMKIFRNHNKAVAYAERANRLVDESLNLGRYPVSSVLSEGRFRVQVTTKLVAFSPAERPRYE